MIGSSRIAEMGQIKANLLILVLDKLVFLGPSLQVRTDWPDSPFKDGFYENFVKAEEKRGILAVIEEYL
jgi:hypothetical protein